MIVHILKMCTFYFVHFFSFLGGVELKTKELELEYYSYFDDNNNNVEVALTGLVDVIVVLGP